MRKLITLAFSIIFTMTAFGQRLEYERTSNWFFGLNAGAAWNTTDVQNKTHAGWGFLLGRSFNYDYGRRISYDLRLRYLRGKWYGQDSDSTNLDNLGDAYNGALSPYKEGLGSTVNNFEANVHHLGLELAIHFNRFRDRTGWDPYIFGGANISWNETYGDLIDQANFLSSDTTYAYDQIAMNKPAIEQALDGNYETALDGTSSNQFNVNFMPSLGIGIGYDVGPRFQIGVEHKTTFTLRDDFDGYVDAEPNWGFLENDVYHYTSAFLRWRFRARGEGRVRTVQPRPQPNPPITGGGGAQPCQLPDVRVTNPLHRTETVQSINYVYRAEVRYVQSRNDIIMRVNGIETTNFLYNPQTHQLESYLYLTSGNNVIELIGRNTCGTDTETSTLIFDDCVDPVVYFENVCTSTFNTSVSQSAYTVQAQIQNATSIELTVNGVRINNYNYNNVTGNFTSNVILNSGQNTIQIVAISGCGRDTGTSVVTYTNCPDPIVSFVSGNNGFVSVSQANFNLSAYIYNVTNQNNISLRVNGSNRNFTFNASTNVVNANLVLTPGVNTIQLTATTSCGTDTETITIDYTPCVNPSIQMIQPIGQSVSTTNGTQFIQASIFNVGNISQIQLFVNGNLQQGGTYNPVTKMFEANVALNSGFNTVQITVLNDCGSATETITVNYNPCNTPDVQMFLPASSGGLTSSPSQLVQAMVFNVSNISEVQTFVNGNLQQGGTFDINTGLYQNTVALTLGVNTIQVVATNGCGSDIETVTITYRACEAPQITMTSPTTNPFYTTADNVDVSAMIGSVTNTSQVQLTVNGTVDNSGATYSSASITYNNNVNLNMGNNVIVIMATNSCGTVTKQISVVRELPVDPLPVDSITICYVHCNNVGDPVTMTIPLSEWPTYQSLGAQLGPCPIVSDPIDLPMTICFEGNNNGPTTIQILTSEWPAYQALGATQGPCPEPTMNICFKGSELTIPVSQWAAYQIEGGVEGPCPVEVEDSIIICVKEAGSTMDPGQTMEIALSEWPMYQAAGATLGPCPVVDPEIVICVDGKEETILTSEWPKYQALGATQGPCPVDDPMQICMVVNGVRTTLTILTSEWPTYQAQGAMQGPCPSLPDPNITICVEQNGVPTTMTILQSQFAGYQAQGAVLGPCPAADPQITICLKNTEMTILTSEWATYQAQGATLGPCPVVDPDMVICLNETEQTIKTSEWPTYQAQGAIEGPCPVIDPDMVICLNETEQTIKTSEWPKYQALGATQGPCPVDPEMVVCVPINNKRVTMTIKTSEWPTYRNKGAIPGECPAPPKITICMDVNGVATTMVIEPSEWASYQAQGASIGACSSDSSIVICANGETKSILESEWPLYANTGATRGPCPVVSQELVTICFNGNELQVLPSAVAEYMSQGATEGPCPVEEMITICVTLNDIRTTMEIPRSQWSTYQAQGATQGPCQALEDPEIDICLNGVDMTIKSSDWDKYQSKGAIKGKCPTQTMTICYNGKTLEIGLDKWATYQARGATMGACVDTNVGNGNNSNSDSLNINLERPTDGGGEDELLFGNRTITICYTPEGSIASQTMQVPLNEWEEYQRKGATLGACTGSVKPVNNGGGNINVNNNGTGNSDGVGNVPVNPNNTGGNLTEPTGGNMPTVGNGSQQANEELIRQQKIEQERIKAEQAEAARKAEEARKKAEQEAAKKESELQRQKDDAAKKAAELKAAQEEARRKAESERVRQEQATKEAATQKAKQEAEARRKAEEARQKAAADKAAQESAARRQAEEAKRKASQEAEAKRKAEQARQKAAADKAARESAARRQAEEAKRKAAQEAEARRKAEQARQKAAAEKAAREKAAREAAARQKAEAAKRKAAAEKAAREKAAKAAAAKKAAEEAAKKKAEEQRKQNEREGGR
ncbi:MAG: hypothetical protein AB8B56_08145 [Crocinitomicaceae bacterium]